MRKVLGFSLLAFSALAGAEDFTIQTFAGGGLPQNFQGTSAVFQGFGGIVTDANGNAYFTTGHTVMRLDSNGVLTLVAGNGTPGFTGDGGLATNAQLNAPLGIAIDGAGNLDIADSGNARIRKVENGAISTIAGGGAWHLFEPGVESILPVEDNRYSRQEATCPVRSTGSLPDAMLL